MSAVDEERIQGLLDDVAACWENMGLSFGTRISKDEERWYAVLHPLPIEIDGKRHEVFNESDSIYLLDIIKLFESVEDVTMHNSEISVCGKIDGAEVWLDLWLYVPEGEEVVDRIRSAPSSTQAPTGKGSNERH